MAVLETLAGFSLERILSEDGRSKTVAVLGSFEGKDGNAVLILARRHFQLAALPDVLTAATSLIPQFKNDVYSKYTATVSSDQGAINLDIIYPATEKHISKYSDQRYYLVHESPAAFEAVTKKYIDSLPATRLQWVYNILDKQAEADRIVFEDTSKDIGFVLLPDQKWDQKQVEGLYMQAIIHRRDLKSVRDITAAHLPLLQNIDRKCKKAIRDLYGVLPEELRLFLHYQPSYYHLHCHCAHLKWDGAGLQAGKAILLDDVIDNVASIGGDYYSRRTLSFSIGENDPLLAALRDAGLVDP